MKKLKSQKLLKPTDGVIEVCLFKIFPHCCWECGPGPPFQRSRLTLWSQYTSSQLMFSWRHRSHVSVNVFCSDWLTAAASQLPPVFTSNLDLSQGTFRSFHGPLPQIVIPGRAEVPQELAPEPWTVPVFIVHFLWSYSKNITLENACNAHNPAIFFSR